MGSPAIGICAAVERVSWGVWDGYEVTLAPRTYVNAVQRAGGLAIVLPPDEAAVGGRRTSCSTGSTPCCSPAAPTSTPAATAPSRTPRPRAPGPSATTSSWRWRAGRWSATCRCSASAAACSCSTSPSAARLDQHLPESIGNELHRTVAGTFGNHEVRLAARNARLPRGRRPRGWWSVPPPPGGRPARRGPAGQRLVGRGRPGRGDRAARPALRAGGRLAPRGGPRQPGDRLAGRGGAWRFSRPYAEQGARGGRRERDRGDRAGDRAGDGRGAAGRGRGGRRRGGAGEGGVPGLARRSRRPTGRRCCAASPTRSPSGSRSWRCSRRATPASRSATPAARSGWSSRPSATTPARPSGCSARRSRSPAAST